MYINSIDKNTSRIPTKPKRQKSSGDDSFAQEVETLLDLGAVDNTSPKKEEQRKRQVPFTTTKPEQSDKTEPSLKESIKKRVLDNGLNITV